MPDNKKLHSKQREQTALRAAEVQVNVRMPVEINQSITDG